MQIQFYIWMAFAWKHIPNLKLLSCLSTYRDRKGAHPERMFMKTKHDRTLRSAQLVADLRTPKIRNHMNLLCKNKDVVFVVCNLYVMYSGNALINFKDGCGWFFCNMTYVTFSQDTLSAMMQWNCCNFHSDFWIEHDCSKLVMFITCFNPYANRYLFDQ